MNTQATCLKCGAPLAHNAGQPFCAVCLLGQAVFGSGAKEGSPVKPDEETSSAEHGARVRYFGDYELLGEIARGGMGIVYRARQVSLNRLVALKMIRAGQLADEAEVKRFRAEAEAAANLDHPNIVAIYEVGEHQGQHYFSMRLVEGQSLAAEVQQSGMRNPKSAARLLATVARAVHHAHQRGLLHRDLKPGNILLDAKDEPFVSDFGLAKRVEVESSLSLSGEVLGTPSFMAPEQAAGRNKQLTTAADIYGLGATLYYVLTGRPPFHGKTALETMRQVEEQEPEPPSALVPRMDRDLETICLKCLEKNPAHRYASADALADDLERWLRQEPILARPSSTWNRLAKWGRRKPAVAALTVAVVMATVLGMVGTLWHAHKANVAERVAVEKLRGSYLSQARANRWSGQPGRRFDSLAALSNAAAIQPSIELRNEAIACLALADVQVASRWELNPRVPVPHGIVFDANLERYARGHDDGSISIRRVQDHGEILRLPGRGHPSEMVLCFSPNGRLLVEKFSTQTTNLFSIWDLSQGKAILQQDLRFTYAPLAFSPDSSMIAVGTSGTLHLFALSELPQEKILPIPFTPLGVSFDAEGKRIAICSDRSTNVLILDVNSPQTPIRLEHPRAVRGVAFSSDGRWLACACYDRKIYLWNALDGSRVRALAGHAFQATMVAFNHADDILVSCGWDYVSHFWDPLTGELLVKIPGDAIKLNGFSPDDSRYGFKMRDRQAGVWQVAPGRECRRWPSTKVESAIWGPEETFLITAGNDGLRFWNVERRQLIGHLETRRAYAAFLHPGRQSLIVCNDDGASERSFAWDARTGQIRIGAESNLWPTTMRGALSPDGDTLIAATGAGDVLVGNLRQPEKAATFKGHDKARFVSVSPDGKWFATGAWGDRGTGVKIWELASKEVIQELPVEGIAQGTFSPDGQHLVTGCASEYRIWRVGSWETVATIPRPLDATDEGRSVFSSDGRMLALEDSFRKGIRLVAAPSGRELAKFEEGWPICFNQAGDRLVAFSESDDRLMVWDLSRIRLQLATMGLDWDMPPLPAARQVSQADRLTFSVQKTTNSAPGPRPARIPARDPQASANTIDLTAYYNCRLTEGWIPPLTPARVAGNALIGFQPGHCVLGGVPFDARGVVQLSSEVMLLRKGSFPNRVDGIPIERACSRLHFLHAAVFDAKAGVEVGRYVVHRADGASQSIPILYGDDVRNWQMATEALKTPSSAEVVWSGTNQLGPIRLFKTTWENPKPEVPIRVLDFISNMTQCAPFLLAVTVEE